MTTSAQIATLPTEFRGCQWNENWEFDAPAVVYYPRNFRRYGYGGNTGVIDELVDEICEALATGEKPGDGGLKAECQWRGWGLRFEKRRNARHVVLHVRWYEEGGELRWEVTKRTETYGLPNPAPCANPAREAGETFQNKTGEKE
ncbi:MAG TPA: hypothetical protein PLI09_28030 [Candidatus Hydrogenedentes bacterium]|nr:hypothetical protein [Candidatus Hydrogenedentota bacterium]